MSNAQVLAKLLEWTDHRHGYWNNPQGKMSDPPAYDTDLNAMREVWHVLKERRLWEAFVAKWTGVYSEDKPILFLDAPAWLDAFLNDLSGQIKAAIKVLKEAQK